MLRESICVKLSLFCRDDFKCIWQTVYETHISLLRRLAPLRLPPQLRVRTSLYHHFLDQMTSDLRTLMRRGTVSVDRAVEWLQYTVSQKTRHQTLHQIITDSQNSLTVRLSRKFVTKSCLNTSPRPIRVATPPCEICVFKKSQFLRSE